MGKSSRQKRRTYQTPTRARAGANLVWYAAAAVLLVAGTLAVALSRSHSTANGVAPTVKDHWHIALGVNDCGTWVPNWAWPNTASNGEKNQVGTALYAPLHSHEDGLIHVEPQTDSQGGNNATLGTYFKYGGWKLNETSIGFTTVVEKNGNQCNGKPGVLRWAVNGTEKHGNPAKYKLAQADVVELVFTTAGAKLPPQTQVPSYSGLQAEIGNTTSTAPVATAATGSTTTPPKNASTTSSPPTTVGATTTSKP